MATGVLVLGIGNGTKKLQGFLDCTKSYEAVVLFGAGTDTYDAVGKVVGRKGYSHITKEKVEEALEKYRGKIMQRPPIFSALRVQGKKLYEYAREGREVPVEIQERPVEVKSLELMDWMEGGTHEHHWPDAEAEKETKEVAEKVLHLEGDGQSGKRKREDEGAVGEVDSSKRSKLTPDRVTAPSSDDDPSLSTAQPPANLAQSQEPEQSCPAPACRLRMTVTSGFYVRSLCHDLGVAVDSMALMSTLVRSRQGDFSLGSEVLEYNALGKGEEVWSPQVKEMLSAWQEREGVEVEPISRDRNPKSGGTAKSEAQVDEGASKDVVDPSKEVADASDGLVKGP